MIFSQIVLKHKKMHVESITIHCLFTLSVLPCPSCALSSSVLPVLEIFTVPRRGDLEGFLRNLLEGRQTSPTPRVIPEFRPFPPASFPSLRNPVPQVPSERIQTKESEREIPSESYHAKDLKRKIPSLRSQVKYRK